MLGALVLNRRASEALPFWPSVDPALSSRLSSGPRRSCGRTYLAGQTASGRSASGSGILTALVGPDQRNSKDP